MTYGPDVSNIPGIETPLSTEEYAKITLNDKISITTPTVAEKLSDIKANEIDDVDITETDNE